MSRHDATVPRHLARTELARAVAELVTPLAKNEALAAALVADGRVFVDGKRARDAATLVAEGTRLVVHVDDARPWAAVSAAPPPLVVIYEDEDVVVIDKRAGELVNETETSSELSVVERLRDRDAFTVHRIDRETSGVVVLAKGRAMAEALSRCFEARETEKTYVAIVRGTVADGVIDAPIGPDRRRPRARAVVASGKPASTRVRTLGATDGLSSIEACPITGRTHQIRVHLAHAGAPIVGDVLYGGPHAVRIRGEIVTPGRVMLHARALVIPVRGARRRFEAPIPADLARFAALGLALDGAAE
ncbi:RluA family pseudouridine synthase [Myxococcota bacterium]|nr:RluA family pseudouridine synthase [Myxococcota bacterium]